jgi:AcrR family transcriptional regulator
MTTTDTTTGRPMRADARRNYERLLEAARAAFTEHGPDASLEDIARRAGVGAGTLYRHFPNRDALLEAVFRTRVEELCAEADELLTHPSARTGLAIWLRAVVLHSTTYRALAASLMAAMLDEGSELTSACHDAMRAAGAALLTRAQEAGEVRADVDISTVLRLVNAVAWATEQTTGGASHIDRLLGVVTDGLRTPAG